MEVCMCVCVCVCTRVCISKVYPYVPYSHNQYGLEATASHATRPLSELHGLLSLLLKVTLNSRGGDRRKRQMMTGGSAGQSLGPGLVLGRPPSGSSTGDPRWPGWAVNVDLGHGGKAVLSTVALELGTGQQEEQSPQGWRRRDIGPQEPGLPRVSAGAKLHCSCLGMAWKIPECSSLSSGTGLYPPRTQTP